jgi:hypothetical protein
MLGAALHAGSLAGIVQDLAKSAVAGARDVRISFG